MDVNTLLIFIPSMINALKILIVLSVLSSPSIDNSCFNFNDKENNAISICPADSIEIIVLKNNRSCNRCFSEISDMLESKNLTAKQIALVTLIDSTEDLNYTQTQLAELMPKTEHYYFDFTTQHSSLFKQYPKPTSIFTQYNIKVTPAVILKTNKGYEVFDYDRLYTNDNFSIEFINSLNSKRKK